MNNLTLVCYAIYEKPLDYPESFVVRRWVGMTPDQHPTAVVPTLTAARQQVPDGLICLPRYRSDDPVIVEVWI